MAVQTILTLALAAVSLGAAEAPSTDVSFEQLTETSVDGRSSGPALRSKSWISGRKMRLEREDTPSVALIVRLDSGTALRVDAGRRVVSKIDLGREQAESRIEMGVVGDLFGERAQATSLGQTRRIAGFDCRGYRIQTDAGFVEVWTTTALPLDAGIFSDLLEWLGAEEAMGPYLDALRRIPGFPLETRTHIEVSGRRIETHSTVTLVRVAPLADTLFQAPPDYRLEDGDADRP